MRVLDFLYNQLWLRYYKVDCGKNFRCNGRLIIQGHGTYKIGNDVTINSKFSANPIGGDRTVFQAFPGGSITIGDRVGLSHAILSSRAGITIEDNVLIGAGVKIYDNDFHSLDYEDRMNGDSNIVAYPVEIKEGAFIGAHAMILKGVTIGKHSVIGAGSVVTKDVPDGEIWAGNPARFVKRIEPIG